ncbi:unnamed protein product, partial [Iphiclides podalirius]
MIEPWNDRNLLPPPVHTYHCLESIDTRNLQRTCRNAINVLSKQSPLHKEGAILSRFLYKYDKKFRNDIGYRIFKKVNTALRRYLTMQPFREKLKTKGLPFLPNGYDIPSNLEEWLDLKNQENFGRFQWSRKNVVKVDPNLIEQTDGDTVDSLIMYINEVNAEDDQLDIKPQPNLEIIEIEPEINLAQKHVDKGKKTLDMNRVQIL